MLRVILLGVFALIITGRPAASQTTIEKIREFEAKVLKNRYQANDSILDYAARQFQLAITLNDSVELGKAHLSMAYAHFNLGNDGDDLNNLIKAREIFRRTGQGLLYSIATLEMASMYREAESKYFQPDSLIHGTAKFFRESNARGLLARCYMELGLNFRNKYRRNIGRDSILYYYLKGKAEADALGDRRLSDAILNDIADYYLLNPHKNLDTVIYLSSKVIESPEPNIRNRAVAHLNRYLALEQQGKPNSFSDLLIGHQLTTMVRPRRLLSQASILLYNHYLKEERYDSALYFSRLAEQHRNGKRGAYFKLLFDSNIKAADAREQQNALLSKNLSIQKNLNSAIIFGVLILLIFIAVVVRTNKVIKKQNEDLERGKEHNAKLLKEIHHRVKNNLQMIVGLLDLQQTATNNKDVTLVLNDAGSRIKSIALIHQNLYKGDTDMVSVGFKKYITELTDNLIFSYDKNDNLDVELDIDEIEMPFNRAVVLGLLITELATNVLKHAFPDNQPGQLSISVKNEEKIISLVVSDNGIGISDEAKSRKDSFGLDLINSFVQDLNATIEFSNEQGTTARVEITIND